VMAPRPVITTRWHRDSVNGEFAGPLVVGMAALTEC
jgi:hypothetical protein